MHEKVEQIIQSIKNPEEPGNKAIRRAFFVLVFFVATVVVVLGGTYGYSAAYQNKVYPGVMVGDHALGGMNQSELKSFVENFNNRYAKEGIDMVAYDGTSARHPLKLYTLVGSDTPIEIIRLDSDSFVNQALALGREGGVVERLFAPLAFLFKPKTVSIPLAVNDSALADTLHDSLSGWEDKAQDATVVFEAKTSLTPTVVSEKTGFIYNYPSLYNRIKTSVALLSFTPIEIKREQFTPRISAAEVTSALPRLTAVLNFGSIGFNYIDTESKQRHDWEITPSEFKDWIETARDDDNTVIFVLNPDKVKTYLETSVRPNIDVPAEEAKFVVSNDKVQEFTASRTGLELDATKTYQDLDTAFRARNYNPAFAIKTVGVTVAITEPQVKTADVNNLGITEIIGVGVSDFHGSTRDRIRNLTTAVKRLNGTLIRPGEEFSTNKYAGPYDEEHGYVPEKVIKGREIKKEVGGGMCQIGTTLFRMAMNTGLPITERHNHSLVVHYYADPVNGNPGTDATVYDPILDLKFVNETSNYALLQTDIDYKNLKLVFTLWGKSDGRKGSYTHPTVSKWFPAGNTEQYYITDGSVKPGVKNCELAYKGAVASFTYTRVTPDGQSIDQKFDSYYRPLPQICMIGAEPGVCPGGAKTCPFTAMSSSTASSDGGLGTSSTTVPISP